MCCMKYFISDSFLFYTSEPSLIYYYKLIVLILLSSFLNKLAMLTHVHIENEQDQVYIFYQYI